MLIQCCVCKKVQREDHWEDMGEHYHYASHTYCPPCAADAWAEVRNFQQVCSPAFARKRQPGSLQDLFQPQRPMARLQADGTV
jgi:hypothetical protein